MNNSTKALRNCLLELKALRDPTLSEIETLIDSCEDLSTEEREFLVASERWSRTRDEGALQTLEKIAQEDSILGAIAQGAFDPEGCLRRLEE